MISGSEKVYPISEKKLLDLRGKGIVPHSKLAARIFTFGVLILSASFFKPRIRRVFFMLTNPDEDKNLDNFSIIVTEASSTLLLLSFLIFSSYLLFSLIETKCLRLPYGKYKEGVRKFKNPISIQTELFLGLFLGPLILLGVFLILKSGDYSSLLRIKENLSRCINIIGAYCIWVSLISSLINKLNFRLTHKMSKEEIIKESLEGQMSPANRNLIAKASSEL